MSNVQYQPNLTDIHIYLRFAALVSLLFYILLALLVNDSALRWEIDNTDALAARRPCAAYQYWQAISRMRTESEVQNISRRRRVQKVCRMDRRSADVF